MTITVNNSDPGNYAIQAEITAINAAISAAAVGSVLAAHLTGRLAGRQRELVINLLNNGRVSAATVLSTLS